MKRASAFFLLILLLTGFGYSFQPQFVSLAKGNGQFNPNIVPMCINQMVCWISANGQTAHAPDNDVNGFSFPAGIPVSMVYAEGLLWGGYCHDGKEPFLRVGGQYYKSGTTAGRILAPGIAQSPDDLALRIYRIRRDFRTMPQRELVREAMIIYNVPEWEVTGKMTARIRQQYEDDWNRWPVEWGAPFYDLNQNGVYEPELGETPGLQNADEVVWFVINDLNSSRVRDLAGSPPIGLEIQITFWAYKSRFSAPLGNGIFHRYRLINKSGFPIDSLFVAQFSDPDLGDYSDDFAGCDSVLNLGYAYNSSPEDYLYRSYGLSPAAVGYLLLQGPLVPSAGDTAIFDFKAKPDFKNLPLTSFEYLTGNQDPFYQNPPLSIYNNTKIFYNLLKGYRGTTDLTHPTPYRVRSGPHSGEITKFPLSGDPITATGDVGGLGTNFSPSDQRIFLSSGPFSLLPDEQQEIITAVIGGLDTNHKYTFPPHLSSLQILRDYVETFKQAYLQMPLISESSYSNSYPDAQHTTTHIRTDFYNSEIKQCTATLHSLSDTAPSFTVELFDDGQHGDGQPKDHIWANSLTVDNQEHAYSTDLIIQTSTGSRTIKNALTHQALRPLPVLENWEIIWENGKQDKKIERYENVCLHFDVRNPDALHSIDSLIIEDTRSWQPKRLFRLSLVPGTTLRSDSLKYMIIMPFYFNQDSITLNLRLRYNGIIQNLYPAFPVIKWLPHASRGTTLQVQTEKGWPKNVLPVIADPSALNGHRYQITVEQSVSDSTEFIWELTDLNTRTTLLEQQQAGHSAKELFPVVQGIEFKVFSEPNFYDFLTVANADGPLIPPEGAAYPIQSGSDPFPQHFPITERQQSNYLKWFISAPIEYINVYSEFLNVVTQNNTLWNSILSYDYEIRFTESGSVGTDSSGVIYHLPFELWNIGIDTPDDSDDDFRLIPFIHDSNQDSVFGYTSDYKTDGFSWLLPLDTAPGEIGYQTAAQQIQSGTFDRKQYQTVFNNMLFKSLNGGTVLPAQLFIPEQGTVFRILTRKPLHKGDRFIVQAPKAQEDNLFELPLTYSLSQNYPNPFNNQTTIQFESSQAGEVEIEIIDILGRRIRQFKRYINGGTPHTIIWDGKNEQGTPVGSGIYFYRLRAGSFSKTLKMILLR